MIERTGATAMPEFSVIRLATPASAKKRLAPKSAEDAAHQRLSELGADLAGDRARDLFDDHLAGRHAARGAAAENPPEHAAEAAAGFLRRFRCGLLGGALLQYFVS